MRLLQRLPPPLPAVTSFALRGVFPVPRSTSYSPAPAWLVTAGIAFDDKGASARAESVVAFPIGDAPRPGGSSWQSLARGTGTIETDYLNGEVVLVGRSVGVPTPANALLQRLSNEFARNRLPPGGVSQDEFMRRLQDAS